MKRAVRTRAHVDLQRDLISWTSVLDFLKANGLKTFQAFTFVFPANVAIHRRIIEIQHPDMVHPWEADR